MHRCPGDAMMWYLFFLNLFERASLTFLPIGAFSIFYDCAVPSLTLKCAVN